MKFFVIFLIISFEVTKLSGKYLRNKCVLYTDHRSVVTTFDTQRYGYAHIMSLPTNNAKSNQYPQKNPSTCSDDEFKCTSLHQCIEKGKQCDGHVNCADGTDEKDCSCVSKLDPNKICDDYFDCPDGSDEVACNGCDHKSYSCYSGVQNQCYQFFEKCNYSADCPNRRDEKDCLLLTPNTTSINPFIRNIEGILHFEHAGSLLPVCTDVFNEYPRIVCEQELGVHVDPTTISVTHVPTTYNGFYVSRMGIGHYMFGKECLESGKNAFVHVQCPHLCGVMPTSTNRTKMASGKDAFGVTHPWMAGLYLNGTFVCAGSILRWKTIITAAHCVHPKGERLTKYDYLQVRVGFIRQHSFSPHEQYITVRRVIIHPDYRKDRHQNDIAVLQLSDRLFFNRWVKPICLQSKEEIGDGNDPNWMWKPDVDTICSTAGWGGFTERGPNPVENLVEVELPIVSACVANNPNVTCAGYPNGSSDNCGVNSGGPLECRNGTNQSAFYLAGIASTGYNYEKGEHEENFCGGPDSVSVFAKTSLHLKWIRNARLEKGANVILPSLICPGVICRTNKRCVKAHDGIVDCMNGEDEVKEF